jgi:DNA-binding CsgD family transcriptional regulator
MFRSEKAFDSPNGPWFPRRLPACYLPPPLEPLSNSEIRVLRYLPTNLSGPEIANELSISPNTVKTHIHNLYAKLGTHGRGEGHASRPFGMKIVISERAGRQRRRGSPRDRGRTSADGSPCAVIRACPAPTASQSGQRESSPGGPRPFQDR